MAGGGGAGSRSLEETPTWAVAVVCFVLVVISIIIEHALHLLGKLLTKHNKRALYEALEKVKSELMLLGFISLLLTVGQGVISKICVPKSNKVPLISTDGIHQLHIFIFVLAITHVLYCITTMALGRLKMRRWKVWEEETKSAEYQFSNNPDRFRFARETSFGRRHLSFWSTNPILIWIVCFFRQFIRSVFKVDYMTLRHGFIMAHLAPHSSTKFDFQKYIKRSLENDFKVVVGISPTIWFSAVVFLLFNTHGWNSYLWMPFIPLVIILLVGTKLQVIITKMALQIMERGDVVKGMPVVQPADDLFWFNRPHLLLYLIHFVLFQNAFQIAFFAWSWYEFGYPSCFHKRVEDMIIRISMGILIQVLCSYVTLPLYALVTQMGSKMKATIFTERVAVALRKWHQTAKKHLKENQRSGSNTPMSTSRPITPSYGSSPMHLLRYYRSEVDSTQASPMRHNGDDNHFDIERSPSPAQHTVSGSNAQHLKANLQQMMMREMEEISSNSRTLPSNTDEIQIHVDKGSSESQEFSFERS
ncbi:mlo protein [Dioscorea alata]|uniref:Mlo protein n=1 Tax=Dioscorea alata TaxID=55571 RepID=A0ACB7WQK4_DIOAL|nr:mlo protein [Dioscorea alata]